MHFLHAFGLAVQFLTRLPVPRGVRYTPEALGWSVVFYPLVGLLAGALLVALKTVLAGAGPLLAAALLLVAWVGVTGGLHVDGLADCADAWVGGQGERERSLRIMKDPYSGPIAVATVMLLLLVKFAALAEQPSAAALLWTPVIGRGLLPFWLLTTPYVRPGGLGSPLAENLPRRAGGLSVGLALVGAALALGPLPVLMAVLAAWGLRRLMLQRLGGCTGDTLGAGVEIVEAVVLVVCALGGRALA
jgi:adenosylcobinamide-GDP ribazoletransferase